MKEEYLGDGLYASFDGEQICLRAPREGGDHYIYMEPSILRTFLAYVEALKRHSTAIGE